MSVYTVKRRDGKEFVVKNFLRDNKNFVGLFDDENGMEKILKTFKEEDIVSVQEVFNATAPPPSYYSCIKKDIETQTEELSFFKIIEDKIIFFLILIFLIVLILLYYSATHQKCSNLNEFSILKVVIERIISFF